MAWGRNQEGQLGVGTTTDRATPVQMDQNVTLISAGKRHSVYPKMIRVYGQLDGMIMDNLEMVPK